MKNNLVIENGSALPRNIIFGSLRQEIIRRLQNTSKDVGQETRIQLVEDDTTYGQQQTQVCIYKICSPSGNYEIFTYGIQSWTAIRKPTTYASS